MKINDVITIVSIPDYYHKLNKNDFINRLAIIKQITWENGKPSWLKVLVLGKKEIWLPENSIKEVS
jgi:hypothetical protein